MRLGENITIRHEAQDAEQAAQQKKLNLNYLCISATSLVLQLYSLWHHRISFTNRNDSNCWQHLSAPGVNVVCGVTILFLISLISESGGSHWGWDRAPQNEPLGHLPAIMRNAVYLHCSKSNPTPSVEMTFTVTSGWGCVYQDYWKLSVLICSPKPIHRHISLETVQDVGLPKHSLECFSLKRMELVFEICVCQLQRRHVCVVRFPSWECRLIVLFWVSIVWSRRNQSLYKYQRSSAGNSQVHKGAAELGFACMNGKYVGCVFKPTCRVRVTGGSHALLRVAFARGLSRFDCLDVIFYI